jgi:hypothetical protein
MSAEQQTQNFYLNVAPMYADPVVRQLYVEIALDDALDRYMAEKCRDTEATTEVGEKRLQLP